MEGFCLELAPWDLRLIAIVRLCVEGSGYVGKNMRERTMVTDELHQINLNN